MNTMKSIITLLAAKLLGTKGVAPATSLPPKGWLDDEEDALVPPRRFWQNPSESVSHYYRWVWEYLAYLTLLCGLERESDVLELGCSHGRTAHGLTQYLRHGGSYHGIDIVREQIDEANARILPGRPVFTFLHADIYNRHYNPSGQERAESYRFPFESRAFDVVYAASVFTHLLPAETENYLRETRRVLRPGGRALFSFILLDHYRGSGTTTSPRYELEFTLPDEPDVRVRDPKYPDDLIAYSIASLERMTAAADLVIVRILKGLWSGSPGLAVNEQDLVLLAPR